MISILLVLVMTVGMGLILYPTLSDYYNSLHQSRAIMHYAQSISGIDREKSDEILARAREYNKALSRQGISLGNIPEEDYAVYQAELAPDDTGMMGYLEIEKINLRLPVFHGTSDKVLRAAIGHLEGTSLPVGGTGSHCTLSGHRGLPSARLFTDLDQLKEGDTFVLHILTETLTYEVDQIRIVEPRVVSDLRIDPGHDYVTLLTCTPYGVNSHRLLVRGHRIANLDGELNIISDAIQIRPALIAPFLCAPILFALFLYVVFSPGSRNKVRQQVMEKYSREQGLTLEQESEVEIPDLSGIVVRRKKK